MHGNRRPNPKRICKMIPPRIGRVRMNQNAQCSMIEHQPWHQGGKHFRGKGDLKHRLIMRTHFHVMPASQGDGKAFAYPTAKLLGLRTRRRRIVVNVSVIACDFVYRSRCQCLRQISQLGTFSLLSPRVLEEFVDPVSQHISKNAQVKSNSGRLLQTTSFQA
jgi:hypothetical protein